MPLLLILQIGRCSPHACRKHRVLVRQCSEERAVPASVSGVRVQQLVAWGALGQGTWADARGHSVLWNAVAFEQPQVALYPPFPEHARA